MARIDLPTDPTDIITLAKAVHDKHVALGAATPLGNIKWDALAPKITQAETFDKEADRLRTQSEQARQKRDNFVPELTALVRNARKILTGTYADELRTLEDFGYNVDDTPKRNAAPAPQPAPV